VRVLVLPRAKRSRTAVSAYHRARSYPGADEYGQANHGEHPFAHTGEKEEQQYRAPDDYSAQSLDPGVRLRLLIGSAHPADPGK
jgi:hypothetical protein